MSYRKRSSMEYFLGNSGIEYLVDDALFELFAGTDNLGKSGKSDDSGNQTSVSSGNSPSAYTSSQSDNGSSAGTVKGVNNDNSSGSSWIAALINLVGTAGSMIYNWKAAEKSYERQNEYYENHLSMPAKVKEYQDAGLNPMGLAGAGVGATSAPSVQQAAPVDIAGSMNGLVSTLLEYKLKSRELDIQQQLANNDTTRTGSTVALNEANIGKIFKETDKVDAETFILQVQGKYADDKEKAALDNLLKDLDVKDATISKTEAEEAKTWIEASWIPKMNESQIKVNDANARAANARAAVDEYERKYMDEHDGNRPPQGEIASLVTMLMNLFPADKGSGKNATQTVVDTAINPVGPNSPLGGTFRALRELFRKSTNRK